MFILAIGLIIATMILGLFAVLINFGLIYLITFVIGIIVFFQFTGFSLALTYTLFENVDNNKPGFKAVFSTYFGNALKIRKDCVKLAVSITLPVVILYIDAITPEEYENDYALLDAAHKVLDLAGLWSGIIGMVCDVINGAIYLIEWRVFDRDTLDDALYSVIGLIPGGKAGFSKAIKEAQDIGFNPVKLIANIDVDDIDIKFVEEMLLNLGSAVSGAITNGEGWDMGVSMADDIESWISIFAAGLKGA